MRWSPQVLIQQGKPLRKRAILAAMSIDVARMLMQTGALLRGHFRLSSGLHSSSYVQCARLLEHPRDARLIGEALAGHVRGMAPDRIVAPALGGLIIGYTVAEALGLPMIFTERKEGAMTLRRGFEIGRGDSVVIVEDVVTTGRSTLETAAVVESHGGRVAGFASILNRTGGERPFRLPYVYLLALDLEKFDETACDLCARGVPVDAPGSRYSGVAS